MAGCNEENCTCPKTECERHGKCCECINHHRKIPLNPVVFCLRELIEYKPVAEAQNS